MGWERGRVTRVQPSPGRPALIREPSGVRLRGKLHLDGRSVNIHKKGRVIPVISELKLHATALMTTHWHAIPRLVRMMRPSLQHLIIPQMQL